MAQLTFREAIAREGVAAGTPVWVTTGRSGNRSATARLASQPSTTSGSRSTMSGSSGSHVSAQPLSDMIVGASPVPAAVRR